MTALFACIAAIVGILIGGFVGRMAYALPRREYREILRPRCHACGEELPATFVIPIVGYFLKNRRCPHCGEKRGGAVLLAEGVLALSFLFLYLRYPHSYLFFLYAAVIADLLLLSLIDYDIKEVPHSLLLVILALGVLFFILSFFSFTDTFWWEHLVGAFAVSLPLFIVMMITGGAVGGGDIKLLFCLGLLLGYKLILVTFLFGVVLAALVGVILIAVFGKSGRFRLPLVPFLSLGALLAMLFGTSFLSLLF